jgi:hypothetical protein
MARFTQLGDDFLVSLSEHDVYDWSRTWPCFGPAYPVWFHFSKEGDLVDMKLGIEPPGPLVDDACAWGLLRQAGKKVAFEAEIATQL